MAIDYACLTRTLQPSRAVKKILQGRVRDRVHNDVIFVHDCHVELHELRGDRLDFIAASQTFEGQIIASAILKQEPHRDGIKRARNHHPEPTVKEELGTLNFAESLANLVLLVSQRGEIRLLLSRIEIDSSCQLHLFSRSHRLFNSSTEKRSGRRRPDCKLTVEPRGRLIAACTGPDFFVVSKICHQEDDNSEDRVVLADIDHEQHFHVSGDILALDFLYPRDPRTATLLVVYQNHDKSIYRSHYIWDDLDGVQRGQLANSFQIPRDHLVVRRGEQESLSLVIPFLHFPGYALIFGNLVMNFESIDMTTSHRAPLDIRPRGAHDFPWVAWARPAHRTEWNVQHDLFHLARSDGLVLLIESERLLDMPTFEPNSTEHLGLKIDDTLVALDYDLRLDARGHTVDSYDLLATAGSNNQGGMFRMTAGIPFRLVQILGLPIPQHAGLVVQRSDSILDAIKAPELLTCRGLNHGQGTLAELQYGIGMDIIWSMNLGVDTSSLDRIYALPSLTGPGFAAVLCGMANTGVFTFDHTRVEGREPQEVSFEDMIPAATTHLAIARTSSGLLIAVSPFAISVFCPNFEPLFVEMLQEIGKAHIDRASDSVTYTLGGSSLRRDTFAFREGTIFRINGGPGFLLDERDVTSLYCRKFSDVILVAVSTWTKVMIFEDTHMGGFVLRSSYSYVIQPTPVVHSLVVCSLGTNEMREKIILVCGTRDGEVHEFEFSRKASLELRLLQRSSLGSGEVALLDTQHHGPSLGDNGIVALCDKSLFVMSTLNGSSQPFFNWDRLVTYRTLDPARELPTRDRKVVRISIDAASIFEEFGSNDSAQRGNLRILACSDGVLHMLELQSKAHGRVHWNQYPLGGIPIAVVDVPDLNVQAIGMANDHPNQQNHDPDDPFELTVPVVVLRNAVTEMFSAPTFLIQATNEDFWDKITDMRAWETSLDSKMSKGIAISTQRTFRDGNASTGHVYLYSIDPRAETTALIMRTVVAEQEPVMTIAPLDSSKVIIGTSSYVTIYQLHRDAADHEVRLERVRWSTLLLSESCSQISVVGQTVYITTEKSTVLTYIFNERGGWAKTSQVVFMPNGPQKRGLGHLVVPEIKTCLMTCLPDKFAVCRLPTGTNQYFVSVATALLPGVVRDMHRVLDQQPIGWPRRPNTLSVVACGHDGAIYELSFLKYPQFRLLKFIQTMIERDHDLSPDPYWKYKQPNELLHLEPDAVYREGNLHLDGDILSRLYRFQDQRSARHILQALIDAPRATGYRNHDFRTVEERRAAFESIVRDCLDMRDQIDPVSVAIGYLEKLLVSSVFGVPSL